MLEGVLKRAIVPWPFASPVMPAIPDTVVKA